MTRLAVLRSRSQNRHKIFKKTFSAVSLGDVIQVSIVGRNLCKRIYLFTVFLPTPAFLTNKGTVTGEKYWILSYEMMLLAQTMV